MKKNLITLSLYYLLFGIVIIMSFIIIMSLLKYSHLRNHDFALFYNRPLFDGQHGRFVSVIVSNLMVQKIPDYLNLHPEHIHVTITSFLKSCLVILCTLLYTVSCYIFSKKKLYIINFSHILLYSTLFLILFNDNYIFNNTRVYMCTFENAVFFEYPMSMLVYIPFWLLFTILFVNEKKDKYPVYIIILSILSFLTAITIEIINIPTLISLTILSAIFLLKKYKKSWWKYSYFSYLAGIIWFLSDEKDDFTPYHFYNFIYFIKLRFSDFIHIYINEFLKVHSYFLIIIILLLVLIASTAKNNDKTRKFVIIVSVNIVSILLFYFLTFFLAGTDSDNIITNFFPLTYFKWTSIYKMTLLFWIIVCTGYLLDGIDMKIYKYFQSDLCKILLCILVLFIFRENLVLNYLSSLKTFEQKLLDERIMLYKIEKLLLNNSKIPLEFKDSFDEITFGSQSYLTHYNYIHKTNKEDIEFVDNYDISAKFSPDEIEKLDFNSLK